MTEIRNLFHLSVPEYIKRFAYHFKIQTVDNANCLSISELKFFSIKYSMKSNDYHNPRSSLNPELIENLQLNNRRFFFQLRQRFSIVKTFSRNN